VLQSFSKFLQLPVTTASTVLAKQTAEFKSFCNLIGWHGSRSCSRILQELRKMMYKQQLVVQSGNETVVILSVIREVQEQLAGAAILTARRVFLECLCSVE